MLRSPIFHMTTLFLLALILFLLVPVGWIDPLAYTGEIEAERDIALPSAVWDKRHVPAMREKIPRVSAAEACRVMGKATQPFFVDVRSPDAYAKGHIPGAVRLARRPVPELVQGLRKDRLIVVYDNWPHEYYAATRRSFLLSQGGNARMQDLKLLRGGIDAWKESGCRVKAGSTP